MIRSLIEANELQRAIDRMQQWVDTTKELNDLLTMQSANLNDLQQRREANTIAEEDYQRGWSRVQQALIWIYNDWQEQLDKMFPRPKGRRSADVFERQVREKLSGKYRFLRQVAEGDSAIIFKFEDRYSTRPVAVRALKRSDFTHSSRGEEVVGASSGLHPLDHLFEIRHRNIIQVLGAYLDEVPECILLEYVTGAIDLARLLHCGPRPSYEAVKITLQLGEALAYLHAKELIHSKIKPSKVMIDLEGQPMLSALELFSSRGDQLGFRAFQEEITYASPEELQSRSPRGFTDPCLVASQDEQPDYQEEGDKAKPQSDQFSLGLVAYEMLTGRPLFKGNNIMEIFHAREHFFLHERYRRKLLNELPGPRSLRQVLERMLQFDAENRYANLTEAMNDLDRVRLRPPHSVKLVYQSYQRCCARKADLIFSVFRHLKEHDPEYLASLPSTFPHDKPDDAYEKKRCLRLIRQMMVPLLSLEPACMYNLTHLHGFQQRHNRRYAPFLQALKATAQKYDRAYWNDALAQAWEEVIDRVLSDMEPYQAT